MSVQGKMCEPVNLVHGQFLTKMSTFWIKPMDFKDEDKTNPQLSFVWIQYKRYCVTLVIYQAYRYANFVQLGPSPSPRPMAWFGPKERTKIGLQTTTTHHTNLFTRPSIHKTFKVSISIQAEHYSIKNCLLNNHLITVHIKWHSNSLMADHFKGCW